MIVQINDPIPLAFRKISAGNPVAGLTVTVTVVDALTGTVLLSSTAMTEVSSGLYSYQWSSGVQTQMQCLATYFDGSSYYDEFFEVEDVQSGFESLEGRAI